MTSNQIEAVVPFLHEVGGSLLAAAMSIGEKHKALTRLEDEAARIKREIEQARSSLKAMALKNYVASEIESADVLCTRRSLPGKRPTAPSKLPPPMEAPELTLPDAYEQWAESGDETAQKWVEASKRDS